MKRGVFAVLFVFVFSLSFCLATEVTVYNSSLVKTNYTAGSILNGNLNFSLKNVPANAIITSNLGGNISLRDFLKANNKPLVCETLGCKDTYTTASSGATSKSFDYPSKRMFGFKIPGGKNVDVTSINLSMTSTFPASSTIPLRLDYFENGVWEFENASGDYSRISERKSYGCYDSLAPKAGDSEVTSTQYCERITALPHSKVYMLGADLSGNGTRKMTMSLRTENFGEDCSFDAGVSNNCIIQSEDFPLGDYYVCITAESANSYNEYTMVRENTGDNCGFYGSPSETSLADYPIFVKLPLYASSSTFNQGAISDFSEFVRSADNYLEETYRKDCSLGCILPIKISGVGQILQVSAKIKYSTTGSGEISDSLVYDISSTPKLVSFNGSFDLSKLGFVLNSSGLKDLVLSVDGVKILEKKINVVNSLQILSVLPLTPPAGAPTTFTVNVSSGFNVSSYEWNFGDGKVEITPKNSVSHTYLNVSMYTLQVSVKDNRGVVVSKNFTILSGNPAEIINITIASKKAKLSNIVSELNKYPTWQSDYMKSLLKLDEHMTELNRLSEKQNTLFTNEELVKLALELNNLTVPQWVSIASEIPTPFLINAQDIDPTPLRDLSGGVGEEDVSGYKEGISQWERENTFGMILTKRFEVLTDNGQSKFLMNLYSVNLESTSEDESYFIVDKSIEGLHTDGTVEFKDAKNGFSYLTIPPLTKQPIFEFIYSLTDANTTIYVSPEFSKLPYNVVEISPCNFNLVCEPNLKENYQNCRSDCKPVGKTIYWIILVLFAGLFFYTILQEWYKRNYEKVLFEDRAHLFNLVSYIDNMASRNVFEGEIRKRLGEQGWTMERINYAFKKSKGQKVGMYELIPVEKLFAMKRQNESKKQVKANPLVIPATPRMMMPQNTNINKAQNPGENIKRW